jgi:hypothetical protein
MADKEQTPVTNGEFWKGGQLYVQCGATAVPIRKFDSKGEPVKPPAAEKEVSNS